MISYSWLPILLVYIGVVCISCSKSAQNKNGMPETTGATVYVAGDNGKNPVLWKNGIEQTLSESEGYASQVILVGNDIYVAGIVNESGDLLPSGPSGQYVYWKNGTPVKIGNPAFLKSGNASVSVSGNNVYFTNGLSWENGSVIPLQGQGGGFVQSVFTTGNDIYFTGSDSVGDAVYWKNGMLNVVAQGYFPKHNSGSDPMAFCIFVSGSDVYVGGLDSNNTGTYWKNSIATTLHSSVGSFVLGVTSIFVSGKDVYVSANLFLPANSGTNKPAYWKNGIEIDLPLNGATSGYTTSLYVSGDDVYVTGKTSSGAVYWKNGVETMLSFAVEANSIFIRQN
jgi:hypothetical protein